MSIYDEIEKFNFDEIKEYGVLDYYLTLLKFIQMYVNKNYPLNANQMKCIINNNSDHKLDERNFVYLCMYKAFKELVDKKTKENKIFLQRINDGEYVKPESAEEYNQGILTSKEYILEQLWNATHETISIGEEDLKQKM